MKKKIRVRRLEWEGSTRFPPGPVIQLFSGDGFSIIPYSEARIVSDALHDLCDEYDREQRAALAAQTPE